MRVARLYLPGLLQGSQEIELDAAGAHYILRVLRLRPGATLTVFDGSGFEYRASLLNATRRGARIALAGHSKPQTESQLQVTLIQGVSRGERMDLVMQKATELGVAAIVPVLTDRSVVRLDNARAQRRSDHWQRVITSACEQSGRVRVPSLATPVSFDEWLEQEQPPGARLMLQPGASQYLGELGAPEPLEVSVAIGPEGGFSAREQDLLVAGRYTAVSLGPRILRTETAAIALLAMLQAQWGDARSARR